MDTACLAHCLTQEEHEQFERDGYFIVEDALPPQMVKDLNAVVDRLDAQYRPEQGLGPHERFNIMDFIGKDDLFLELIDCPTTFPKVWGILGWHIQLYHSHMGITPAPAPGAQPEKKRFGWHQDSGRLNSDLEGNPRPRVSLKIGYFLTDTTELGRANFYVIPGSHLWNKLEMPEDGVSNPEGATAVRVGPGTAVFFDRRIWHAATPNFSNVPRKVLFYGYSYRWLRPRDNMTVDHYMERSDPIRRQLLGASTGGLGYTSPRDEDVPLRAWMTEHLGEEAVIA
ncbi:MAG: phytanoyl-CoA dioxygenase family protein [Candidatus Poribacteria bacterium]|nr:phytanoyl-CoA dioxygenase family protein [Candidatus Poribacteria bacterium]